MDHPNLADLSNNELLARLDALARSEREALPHLLACLAEVDRRNAHTKPGYTSLFEYCTTKLRYSEDSAYRRIHAARAAHRFPQIYSLLSDGELSLSVVTKLAPHLTPDNADDLLARAKGIPKKEVEAFLAARFPKPETPDLVRAVRGPATASTKVRPPTSPPLPRESASTPATKTVALTSVQQSSAERELPTDNEDLRYQFSFTGSKELRDSLERAKDILWHRHPHGRLEDILSEVLRDFLARHDPQIGLGLKGYRPSTAAASEKKIPRWVRSRVWARDGGRCAYLSPEGRRYAARRGLELDHVKPRALGGASDDPANIRLLCRAHNDSERRRILGEGDPVIHQLGLDQVSG